MRQFYDYVEPPGVAVQVHGGLETRRLHLTAELSNQKEKNRKFLRSANMLVS